jgi:D-alanine--poly(phosphoribitol) ligase subunit 1
VIRRLADGGPADDTSPWARLLHVADRHPRRVAVIEAGAGLDYQELVRAVRGAAARLRAHGVVPGDRVVVAGARTQGLLVAALATMFCGAAYVPLDPAYPRERRAHVVRDCAARLVLTESALLEDPAWGGAGVLPIEDLAAARQDSGEPHTHAPEDGVYIIYTSGSTGWPKGVQLPARSIHNMVTWQVQHSCRPDPVTAQFAPISFDVFFQEVLGTLAGGGTLALVPETARADSFELIEWLALHQVERLFLPYLGLQMLALAVPAHGDPLPHLREVNVAGEPLMITPAIRAFFCSTEHVRLNNHYGQSESAMVSVGTLPEDASTWPVAASVGRPLPGCELLLDTGDDDMTGELLVAGAPIAARYESQPELSGQRWVDVTLDGVTTRAFRTGDSVRELEDGQIQVLGRIDRQVKVRGYRVDLLEVEAVLREQPDVAEAAVVLLDHGRGTRLTGFVTCLPDLPLFDEDSLLEQLAGRLPEHAVPVELRQVPVLPRTTSGKVDRLALEAAGREAGTR